MELTKTEVPLTTGEAKMLEGLKAKTIATLSDKLESQPGLKHKIKEVQAAYDNNQFERLFRHVKRSVNRDHMTPSEERVYESLLWKYEIVVQL